MKRIRWLFVCTFFETESCCEKFFLQVLIKHYKRKHIFADTLKYNHYYYYFEAYWYLPSLPFFLHDFFRVHISNYFHVLIISGIITLNEIKSWIVEQQTTHESENKLFLFLRGKSLATLRERVERQRSVQSSASHNDCDSNSLEGLNLERGDSTQKSRCFELDNQVSSLHQDVAALSMEVWIGFYLLYIYFVIFSKKILICSQEKLCWTVKCARERAKQRKQTKFKEHEIGLREHLFAFFKHTNSIT